MGKHRGKNRVKRYRVVPGDGYPCPRCGKPTEIREHTEVTEKHFAQPFYYSRWFNCIDRRCRTTLIMPPRFIVWKEAREIWE